MKRLFVALLVVTLLLGSALPVFAAYPDPGTGKTNIFMQNIGTNEATVSLVFTTGETGGVAWGDYSTTIPTKAAKYVLYSQFGGSITDGWAGAVEVSATEPLAAIVNMFWDNAGTGLKTAATYTGIDAPSIGVYLPMLALRDGQQVSRLTVQNTEDATANITIQFYNRNGGAAGTKTDQIPAKSEKTYYLDQMSPAPDFSATLGLGSGYVSSDKKIAAVASQHWFNASEAGSGFTAGDTTLWVPAMFRKQFPNGQWNFNAASIQNLGTQTANVHLQFIKQDNSVTFEMDDTILPKAAKAYNTMYLGTQDPTKFNQMTAALGNMWQGTLKVTCTNGQALAGLTIMFPYGTNVTDSLSFNAIRDVDATSKAIAFPAVYRKVGTQWSTTIVQNVSGTAGTLEVRFYRAADGSEVPGGPWIVNIPANGSVRLNCNSGLELPQSALTALGNSFSGGMFITPSAGLRIIGVTNIYWEAEGRSSGYDGFAVP